MRRIYVSVLVFSIMVTMGLAQMQWAKYGDGPVLNDGAFGSWEYHHLIRPYVLEVEDTLRMWYSGCDDSNEHYQIGYAWSLNGTHWTKYSGNPVLKLGSTGEWDSYLLIPSSVMYDGAEYTMYYSARENTILPDTPNWFRVGIARSSDGIHWEKDALNNPVFEGSYDGSWDDRNVAAFAVRYIADQYVMWYDGIAEGKPWKVGRATSPDGIIWTRDTLSNPILYSGETSAKSDYSIIGSSVYQEGTGFELFFSELGLIGYASSDDGISFTKSPWNPVLGRGSYGSWDDGNTIWPHVSYTPETAIYQMWYAGESDAFIGDYAIGYATSLKGLQNLDGPTTYLPLSSSDSIVTAIFTGDTTNLEFWAEVEDIDGAIVDSFQLFDDGVHQDGAAGDGSYANVLTAPAIEGDYGLGLKANRDGNEIINYDKLDWFTTVGPLTCCGLSYSGEDPVFYPGDSPQFFIDMLNCGTTATAKAISVNLSVPADQTFASILGGSSRAYGNIEADSTVTNSLFFWMKIHDDCPGDTNITINMTISSDGTALWEDTFNIYVQSAVRVAEENLNVPQNFCLEQNYPNPFNPTTTISYALPEQTAVKLTVFDILGQEIMMLKDEIQAAGNYSLQWNGTDRFGNQVNTGVYFCRLEAGSFSEVKKMLYLK